MSENIRASIIIPTKNKISRLKIVLKVLEKQITDEHEVIIVFDGCAPEVLTEFREHADYTFKPEVIVLKQGKGRAGARNTGIKKAKGSIIIFLDDDRIPCKNFVAGHIQGHKNKHCVLLGKRMELKLKEEEIENFACSGKIEPCLKDILKKSKLDTTWLKNKYIYMLFGSKSKLRWMSFVTSNVSVKREDIFKTGLFDENYKGWGWEDSDMGYNLAKLDIDFINDPGITNYHITHKTDFVKAYPGELKNYKYFCSKRKYGLVTNLILKFHILRTVKYTLSRIFQNAKKKDK